MRNSVSAGEQKVIDYKLLENQTINYLEKYTSFNIEELVKIHRISKTQAHHLIRQMKKHGIIEDTADTLQFRLGKSDGRKLIYRLRSVLNEQR